MKKLMVVITAAIVFSVSFLCMTYARSTRAKAGTDTITLALINSNKDTNRFIKKLKGIGKIYQN